MKKIMLLMILMCQMFCPLSAPAQDSGPSRVEELLLQDSMLVLWSMGLKESEPKNQDTLCRDALFFVILSEDSFVCGVERSRYPELFRGIPENYQGFISKRKVEEAARTIFGQEVSQHVAFKGSYFDGNGYFLDFGALSDKTGNICNLSPDNLLPGYANVEMMEPIDEKHWEMFGRLQRFKEVDGGEIVWKEATFHVIVHHQDGKLLLRSFEFTEQAMG